MITGDFKKIYTVSSRFEADLVMDALHKYDIPAILKIHEEVAYDGLFIPQLGWASILVPECMEEMAMEIIHSIRNTFEA
jgi:hypothetical protein